MFIIWQKPMICCSFRGFKNFKAFIFTLCVYLSPKFWAWPSRNSFLSSLTCRWLYLQLAPKDRYSVSPWALHSAWPCRIENMLDNGPELTSGAKMQRLIRKSHMRLPRTEICLVTLVTKRWGPFSSDPKWQLRLTSRLRRSRIASAHRDELEN